MKTYLSYLFIILIAISCQNYEKEYYDNGKLKSNIPLNKSNFYQGKGIFYNKEGEIIKTKNYQNGSLEKSTIFHKNGQVRWTCTYNEGIKHGDYFSYYINGAKKLEIVYEEGESIERKMYDSIGVLIYQFKKLDVNDLPPFKKEFMVFNQDSLTSEKFIPVRFEIPNIYSSQLIPFIINGEADVEDRINGIWVVKTNKESDSLMLGIRIEMNDTLVYRYGWQSYLIKNKRR